MRSRRGSWNVDRGMRREECGMGRKGGKIHCHCQNKFSFWNPLKISFEAKLLEKCKRRTKKLNKNTQKIRKTDNEGGAQAERERRAKRREEESRREEMLSWAKQQKKQEKIENITKLLWLSRLPSLLALLFSLSLSLYLPLPAVHSIQHWPVVLHLFANSPIARKRRKS